MSKKKQPNLLPPPAEPVLLHACCAPCSGAIVEWMLKNEISPTIYYYNPNIYPREEYEIRRDESRRHAQQLGLKWVEGEYDHDAWLHTVEGLEDEPERGARCLRCFAMRLKATAQMAKENGYGCITTTLASSRWKRQDQIEEAGAQAQEETGVTFWPQNWRKDGLSERRAQILREFSFYNQLYCGCEFSQRKNREKDEQKGEQNNEQRG